MVEVTVLIADDDELFREALAMFLGDLPGVTVAGAAADGREAVELCGATDPDVVVLDLDMPGLDGFEAARLIRDRPDPPRIVICTGAAYCDLERDAVAAGADAVICKAGVEDFERALRGAIGAGRARRSAAVRRPRTDEQPQHDRQHH